MNNINELLSQCPQSARHLEQADNLFQTYGKNIEEKQWMHDTRGMAIVLAVDDGRTHLLTAADLRLFQSLIHRAMDNHKAMENDNIGRRIMEIPL